MGTSSRVPQAVDSGFSAFWSGSHGSLPNITCSIGFSASEFEAEQRALMHQWVAQNSFGHRFACWVAQDRLVNWCKSSSGIFGS